MDDNKVLLYNIAISNEEVEVKYMIFHLFIYKGILQIHKLTSSQLA